MTTNLTSGAVDSAKKVAPWRSGLAWWIILVEGIVLAVIGLLVLLNPQGVNQNLAVIFTGALAVAGLLQLWAVFRQRVPETVDSLVSGRASVALFAGLVILLLHFRNHLTLPVGLTTIGLACLVYGLAGLILAFKWHEAGRRVAIIEMIFFIVVGVLMLYAQFGGTDELLVVTQIIGWLALLAGAGLIAFALYRRSRSDEATAEGPDQTAAPQQPPMSAAAASASVEGPADDAAANTEN